MKTPSSLRLLSRRQVSALFGIAVAGVLAGCSDPADKVSKSATSEPKEVAKPAASAKDYAIRSESKVEFVGSKVTGSHNGGFKKFEGKISVAGGAVSAATVKIDTTSIWSDNDRLTGHLKSPDFFDVQKFPTATFTVVSVTAGEKEKTVTGNLELHGVTKSITFPADIQISDDTVTVKAEFAINRRDFGINYAGKANDLIRDNVVLKLDVKATPGDPRPEDKLGG
jgi:polyisoprenoid-binding protein YceI